MSVKFTARGYIEVYRDGVFISRHRLEREAVESATESGPGTYRIVYPEVEVRVIGSVADQQSADSQAPTIPQDLSATAINRTRIDLSWSASTDNVAVSGYQVFRDGIPLNTVSHPTTTYTDTSGLTASTLYTYTVLAFDAAGNSSAQSGQASATTPANSPPAWSSISDQQLLVGSSFSLNLNSFISDGDFDAIDYSQVSGTLPSGLTFTAATGIIAGTPTTSGQTGAMVFRADDGFDTADVSFSISTLDADVTAPPTPTGLAGSAVSTSQVNLSWNASVDAQGGANEQVTGTQDYRVYRDSGLITTTSGTTYSDTGVSADTTYAYQVSARDVAGNESSLSSAVNVATPAAGSFDFYVSVSGTGNATTGGTLADPWPITMLNDATARGRYAGNRVGIMDGTYNLFSIMGSPPEGQNGTNRINVIGGSSGSPTVIQAVNVHQAIIEFGRSSIPGLGSSLDPESASLGPVGGTSYVTIDGLKYQDGNYQHLSAQTDSDGTATTNLVIQNCWFTDQFYTSLVGTQGKNSGQVKWQHVTDSVIRNCRFEQAGAPSDGNRHAMIHCYSSDDNVIELCTFIGQANGVGGALGPSSNLIHFKGNAGNSVSRPGRRNTVRYCYFEASNTGGSGVRWHSDTDTAGNETLHHCVFNVGSTSDFPAFISEGADNNWLIYNNTFACGRTSQALLDNLHASNPVSVSFYNNIVQATGYGSRGYTQIQALASVGTWNYNLYNTSTSAFSINTVADADYSSLAAWQAASGADANAATTTNVQFTGTGSGAARFDLAGGSPALTLGEGGTEIGAWAGQSQIGSDF